jgi:prepilin-type N-terminal cleavage/methylation domain-containing protein
MTRLRGRFAAARNSDGFTLVELLVVMTILTMLMGAVTGTLIVTQRQVGNDSSRLDQQQQATVAEEAMTRAMRTAIQPKQLDGTCSICSTSAFLAGDVRSMTFYANLNNEGKTDSAGYTTDGPSKVTYTVTSAGRLTETVQRPNAHLPTDYNYAWCDPTLSTCVQTVRTVAYGVNTSATLFTYYDKSGVTLTTPLDSSAAGLSAVDSLDIALKVQRNINVPATTVVTRVTLPNADAALLTTS